MKKVLRFPPSKGGEPIPRPLFHSTGDRYLYIELAGDDLLHLGFFPGATFVILKGAVWDKLPHAVEIEGRLYMGVVQSAGLTVANFFCWHDPALSRIHRLKDLKVLGPLIELYPHGREGPRWVLHAHTAKGMDSRLLGRLLKVVAK